MACEFRSGMADLTANCYTLTLLFTFWGHS